MCAAGYIHDVLLVLAVEYQPCQIRLEVAELELAEAIPVLIESVGRGISAVLKSICASRNIIKPST